MTDPITIRDVAVKAYVSIATVSAVLNNNKFVSPELRLRVKDAIEELNYTPNLVARSLKMRETKTIGLIFTNITSPIWPPLVRSAQKITREAGFDILLVTTDEDVEREKTSLLNMVSKRVDGILITPASSSICEHIHYAAQNLPLIVIERKLPDVESVITNNEEISYTAVQHLVDHGYRNIGLVTIPLLSSNTTDRLNGYKSALLEKDLFKPNLIKETDFAGNTAFVSALELLSTTNVDAIFTTSQSTAMGVIQAATKLGRQIPGDLALFGYDDVPWMEVVASPVSTIRQPIEEMARLATELLLENLSGREHSDATNILESSMIIRKSCGC